MIRYVVIAILNILDLLITYIGIEKVDGIKETNPLADYMIGAGWEYACLHKAIGVGIIVYLIESMKKKDEERAKRWSWGVCLVFAVICLNNAYQLLRAMS